MKQTRNNQPYPIGLLGNFYDISNSQNEKMKNKPNLYIELLPPKAAQPNNQSSLINNQLKGEPNFTPNFVTNIYPPKAVFPKKSKIIKKNAFYKFWTLTHLTPYTTKTYINISPQNTIHERSLNTVFLAEKMQKKTNLMNSQMSLSEVVLISRPWRIPKNYQ